MFFFVVFYGLDWVATVPPTVALCRECFGVERAGVVFGWVFASHMVGAGISAWFAGAVREAPAATTPPGGSPAASACWLRSPAPSSLAATRSSRPPPPRTPSPTPH